MAENNIPHLPREIIQVKLLQGGLIECPIGTTSAQLLPEATSPVGLPWLGALVNNDVCSLSYPLTVNCQIQFLTFADRHGMRIYHRSLSFLLVKAVRDLFPDARCSVEHSLGSAYYCDYSENGDLGIPEEKLAALESHMRTLVAENLTFERMRVSFEEAYRYLESTRQHDKLNLLRFRNPPRITVFRCQDFFDLDRGVMAHSSGALTHFKLIAHAHGFVLQFPEWQDGVLSMPVYKPEPHLFDIFQEHKKWGKIIGINTVGDLNATIADKRLNDLVRTSEAFHEKKIGRIADAIAERKGEVRWIFIAGPSSAGKTTTSKRLAVHLRVNGIRPINLEMDNYFVGRDRTPLDDSGAYDFEHLQALDLELLNDHLVKLDRGEEIEVPYFNFAKGQREYHGTKLRLEEDQVMVIEGIHGLNPELTKIIPADHRMRIYISCLTQLKLDLNNRMSTTDMRLIRRMTRDNLYRGHNALSTLKMWPSVRRGEKRWIFPFQSEADITFNSSLDYELAVLKNFVKPLLLEVKPWHEEYAEARRMLDFLEFVVSAPADAVPHNSIIREFIGQSAFRY